jgi:hypothetical protein
MKNWNVKLRREYKNTVISEIQFLTAKENQTAINCTTFCTRQCPKQWDLFQATLGLNIYIIMTRQHSLFTYLTTILINSPPIKALYPSAAYQCCTGMLLVFLSNCCWRVCDTETDSGSCWWRAVATLYCCCQLCHRWGLQYYSPGKSQVVGRIRCRWLEGSCLEGLALRALSCRPKGPVAWNVCKETQFISGSFYLGNKKSTDRGVRAFLLRDLQVIYDALFWG